MKRILALCLVFLFACPPLPLYGDERSGPTVLLSIESYDKTLLRQEVSAFTFQEALQKLADENELELTFTQSGSESKIYSLNHIQNARFGSNDGWFGCIYRKEALLRPDDYLGLALAQGDVLTLYYGDPEETRLLSLFQMWRLGDAVSFFAQTERTEWISQNGAWIETSARVPVPGLKIHLLVPGGTQKIMNTDVQGRASATLSALGVYRYYGEAYVFNRCPSVVRTRDDYFLYGPQDSAEITRAEAAAFIVNSFLPKPGERELAFTDVNASTAHVKEIRTAVSAGLIGGYEDGTFRPEQRISLLEFCVMLSGLYPPVENPAEVLGAPAWAQERLNRLLAAGVLQGVSLDWGGAVGEETLLRIYWNAL